MDRTTNESKKVYDYISRYTKFPYYYQELDQKYFYGITDHLNKNITVLIHKVNDYDTLDLLALNYYGRPDFYWSIADFNGIKDPLIDLPKKFKTIRIPTLTQIYYGS